MNCLLKAKCCLNELIKSMDSSRFISVAFVVVIFFEGLYIIYLFCAKIQKIYRTHLYIFNVL